MDDSKLIELQEIIKKKQIKIKRAQRELFELKDRQRTNKLIKAGMVIEAAGLLDCFDYNQTLQTLLIHKEECLCPGKQNR